VPGGTLIYFVVQNNGQTVVGLRFLLDGQELDFDVEPEINGSAGRYYFTYPYDPQMHGRAQRLEVSFETASGIQNTHLYELVHGLRRLKRVDPA
jgi:hypothetical protein